MEKHSCKLCHRRFSNGRALGGHMRSHIAPSKLHPQQHHHHHHHDHHHHHHHHHHPSSSYSATASEERSTPAPTETNYALRENPKKSFRLVDPEFSSVEMVINGGGSSIVLQDRESETDSSEPPSTRRRSKRRRRTAGPDPEPVSSVSDTTPDEDVARCLMMLSRDVWAAGPSPGTKPSNLRTPTAMAGPRSSRSKYRCNTCNKVFRSHQALGGHRASHKNFKEKPAEDEEEEGEEEEKSDNLIIQEVDSEVNFPQWRGSAERKIHECPICFRVFGSGQALGGHKRSHLVNPITVQAEPAAIKKGTKEKNLFDLNLPPAEEDGELSAVFDAET